MHCSPEDGAGAWPQGPPIAKNSSNGAALGIEAVQEGAQCVPAQPGGARGKALVVGALRLRAIDGRIAIARNPLQVMQVLLGRCAGGCRTVHRLRTLAAAH